MSDSEMRRLFANRLKYYLNLNGYTQADMARYMNVTTAIKKDPRGYPARVSS